jgi:hypothetical protein
LSRERAKLSQAFIEVEAQFEDFLRFPQLIIYLLLYSQLGSVLFSDNHNILPETAITLESSKTRCIASTEGDLNGAIIKML